jgi:hypothetical protein
VVPNCVSEPGGVSYDLNSWSSRKGAKAADTTYEVEMPDLPAANQGISAAAMAASNSSGCVGWRQTGGCSSAGR